MARFPTWILVKSRVGGDRRGGKAVWRYTPGEAPRVRGTEVIKGCHRVVFGEVPGAFLCVALGMRFAVLGWGRQRQRRG